MILRQYLSTVLAAGMVLMPVTASAESHAMGYHMANLDDLEFVPFGETPVQWSILWGDPTTGPSGFLLKVPPGFDSGLHAHTAGYRAFVIEGTAAHWLEGESKESVEPVTSGGWFAQPGGQVHGDANVSDGENLVLVIVDGPFDFLPPE